MNKHENPSLYSPLVLAYIGDAVFEVYTRQKLLSIHPDMPAHKLHKENIRYVNAKAQSCGMEAVLPLLTELELSVYKRGRNAKSATVPKHADLADYRRATGFEALLGYLNLSGQAERLNDIMEKAFENAFQTQN